MNKGLFEIPNTWYWAILSDIGSIAAGGTPSTKEKENFNGDISWLTPADLSGYTSKYISHGKRNLSEQGLRNSSAVLLPKGSILFSSRAPIGYVVIAENPISTNQEFKNITVFEPVFNEYVYNYLKASKNLAEKNASGTTFLEISARNFSNLPIPIPPIPEQHRIVAKIEELFTRLDAGVEALKQVQVQLKRYRQSVLKAAVEGRLTAEWRKQHLPAPNNVRQAGRDELEPADKLLERIQEERKAKLGKKYKEPMPVDTSDLPKLPEKWEWARIEDVSSRVTVGHVGPMKNEYVDNGIPFLRSQNVRANKFDPNNLKYIDIRFHKRLIKSALNPKDVVIVRSGNVGISCVIPNHLKEANCADLVIVKKPLGIIPELLSIYMNSVTQSRISKHKVGVALTHFNTQSVASFSIPIPPIIEQRRIVQDIENRFSIVDAVEDKIYQRLKQTQSLRQSILKRAFEGKLVPQDAGDPPASVLLEKIKAEKVKPKKSKQLEIF